MERVSWRPPNFSIAANPKCKQPTKGHSRCLRGACFPEDTQTARSGNPSWPSNDTFNKIFELKPIEMSSLPDILVSTVFSSNATFPNVREHCAQDWKEVGVDGTHLCCLPPREATYCVRNAQACSYEFLENVKIVGLLQLYYTGVGVGDSQNREFWTVWVAPLPTSFCHCRKPPNSRKPHIMMLSKSVNR